MSDRPKSIQIDYDLFLEMIRYITSHVDPGDESIRKILDGIKEKLEAMQKRDYYTLHKTGKTPADLGEYVREYQELLNKIETLRW